MSCHVTFDIPQAAQIVGDGEHPLVAIPVYNAYHDTIACVESVLRHTAHVVPVLIVDDAGGDDRAFDLIRDSPMCHNRTVVILHHQINSGFVGSCNDAFAIGGRRDVVLVNSDVVVGAEWLDRLTAAACSSTTIATASTLTNHGTLLSVPNLFRPTPQLPIGHTPDTAARAVADASRQLRPTIPTAIGHCVYIKRFALDLVGSFDSTFGRGYGEEVDFSQRCVEMGLRHICADDVFVFHRGGGSFGSEASHSQNENEKVVNGRYPWYRDWVWTAEHDRHSLLVAALLSASAALRGLTIAIDARALGGELTGTQQVIIETIRSLSEHPHVSKVVAYLPGKLPSYARTRLTHENISFVEESEVWTKSVGLCDVAYRPFQVGALSDLGFLKRIGRFTAINQLDCIAFSNPTYFPNHLMWLHYRSTTRAAFSVVDGIAYLSKASQEAARAEGLISSQIAEKVVYANAEFEPLSTKVRPKSLGTSDNPFLLLLGASYLHKNRVFAMRVLHELRSRGWNGKLVMVGPLPSSGTSTGLEAGLFLEDPTLREHVHILPSISEDEKAWLFSNASLALYPTTVEGFGLVPFEAAAYGCPTLSTRQGSLDEVLPSDLPTFDGFGVQEASDIVMQVLADSVLREHIVSSLRKASVHFSAKRTTDLLVELFFDVIARPSSRSTSIIGEDGHKVEFAPLNDEIDVLNGAPGVLIRLGWRFTLLKRLISPAGSRRQLLIRWTANKARRLLKR